MGDAKAAAVVKAPAARARSASRAERVSPDAGAMGFAPQNALGNKGLDRLVRARAVQLKLVVSSPADPHEREADAVADALVGPVHDHGVSPRASASGGVVHRACAACESGGAPCPHCAEELRTLVISRRAESPSANGHDDRENASSLVGKLGAGRPLEPSVRRTFEPRLGRDLGDVRVHTSGAAGEAAHGLRAHAFTVGSNIAFAPGRYRPETREGRHLLAHELAHVVQQGDGSTVSRDSGGAPAPPVDTNAVTDAVDIILKALRGITTSSDSAKIMAQFEGKSAGFVRAVLSQFKSHASEENETGESMIAWLFGDLTAEHRKALRALLIKLQVLDDLRAALVKDILSALNIFTTEGESQDVAQIFSQLSAGEGDRLLEALEPAAGKNERAMAEALMGGLDRVTADRLRKQFYDNAGPRAVRYAAHFTAAKILSLVEGAFGFVSHSESTQVLDNFRATPTEYRPLVQEYLDERVSRKGETATTESVLMAKLDRGDYDELRKFPGLKLAENKNPETTGDKVLSGIKWGVMVLEWTTCGMIGIATGLLSAIWDIVKGIWDILKAAYHLVMLLAYAVSGGAVGRDSYLATKEFFAGLGQLWDNPGKVFDQMWGDLKAEFTTIEGPLADCRRAEFIVRKGIGVIVNIVLIFVAGYGLAKMAVSGAEGVAEFANLAQKVGTARAVATTAGRAGRAIVKFVTVAAGDVGKFLQALSRPIETLAKIQRSLNLILLAAEDETFWLSLRNRAGQAVENEKQFWRERKDFWRSSATEQQAAKDGLQAEADAINEALRDPDAPKVPEGKDEAFTNLENRADDVKADADKLQGEVKGEPKAGAAGELPKEYLDWEKTLSAETRAALEGDEELRRLFAEMDAEVRRLLTHCSDLCIPTKPRPSPDNIRRIKGMLRRLGVSGDDPALREYFYVRRETLTSAIDELYDAKDLTELRARLDKAVASYAERSKGVATRGSDGRWRYTRDGRTVEEYTVGGYSDLRAADLRSGGFFNAHHGIQGEWGRARLPKWYDYDEAPTILLRDTRSGTPHRIVTDRQAGRAAGMAGRTYAEERALLKADMAAAGVPSTAVDQLIADSDRFFADIFAKLKPRMKPANLTEIFGTWTP